MISCVCETNADGISLCNYCCERFEEFLGCIVDVVADLTRVMGDTKTTATYGHRTSTATKMHPDLPINVDAYDKRQAIQTYLTQTCYRIAQQTRTRYGLSIQALTDYLFANIPHLRKNSYGPEVIQELTRLVSAGQGVTATAEPKTFAGTCASCDTNLYARQGDTEVRCRTCGNTYEVLTWRAHARTAKEYHVGTPAELSRALTSPAWGIDVSADLIWRWAKRGKLQRANEETNENGIPLKPTYRLKDVLNLNAQRKPLNGQAA